MQSLKDILLQYRSSKIWTQEKMAEEIGISLCTYVNVENGKEPSMLTKAKIANFLGLDISQIK